MKRNTPFNLVIIGDGLASQKLLEELDRHPVSSRFTITVLGENPHPDSDWLHLASSVSTSLSLPKNLRIWRAGEATRIQRARKTVETERGEVVSYDKLVIATGSSPAIPEIEGCELDSIFTYQTEEDLEAVRRRSSRCRKATILGGGLLGFKAAKTCVDAGLETVLLEYDDLLMPRHLDDKSGLINSYLASIGVSVRTDARPKCFTGHDRVTCVRLIGDAMIPTDLVVICADVRPNDQLAEAASLPTATEGGIIVDNALRTADPDIFAIGECASFNGMLCGLVSPGYAMASVLAANLCGEKTAFKGPDIDTKLMRLGLDPERLSADTVPRPNRRLKINRCYEDRPRVF